MGLREREAETKDACGRFLGDFTEGIWSPVRGGKCSGGALWDNAGFCNVIRRPEHRAIWAKVERARLMCSRAREENSSIFSIPKYVLGQQLGSGGPYWMLGSKVVSDPFHRAYEKKWSKWASLADSKSVSWKDAGEMSIDQSRCSGIFMQYLHLFNEEPKQA